MKALNVLWILLIACAARGWSHEAPVPVNRMHAMVDGGQVRIDFHSGAPWWVLEVLQERTPPPTDWPVDVQAAVKTYFDAHFQLQADGKPLTSTLIHHRYSEEIWNYYLGSQLDLEFTYAMPPGVHQLSGSATFYKEEAAERTLHPHLSTLPPPEFKTFLKTSGRAPRSLVLTLEQPSFSFPVADVARTPAQRERDAWWAGLTFWQSSAWVALLVAAAQLQMRTRRPVTLCAGLLAGSILVGAGALAWRQESAAGYALGAILALCALAATIELGLRVYYRRLLHASQSQAPNLFNSQVRFLSLLIGGTALFLLAQTLGKPL